MAPTMNARIHFELPQIPPSTGTLIPRYTRIPVWAGGYDTAPGSPQQPDPNVATSGDFFIRISHRTGPSPQYQDAGLIIATLSTVGSSERFADRVLLAVRRAAKAGSLNMGIGPGFEVARAEIELEHIRVRWGAARHPLHFTGTLFPDCYNLGPTTHRLSVVTELQPVGWDAILRIMKMRGGVDVLELDVKVTTVP